MLLAMCEECLECQSLLGLKRCEPSLVRWERIEKQDDDVAPRLMTKDDRVNCMTCQYRRRCTLAQARRCNCLAD